GRTCLEACLQSRQHEVPRVFEVTDTLVPVRALSPALVRQRHLCLLTRRLQPYFHARRRAPLSQRRDLRRRVPAEYQELRPPVGEHLAPLAPALARRIGGVEVDLVRTAG